VATASTGAGRYRQPRSGADPAGVAVIVGTWQAQLLLRHNTPAHCSILSRFEAGRCELGPGVGVPRIAQDLRAKQAPNMVGASVTIAPPAIPAIGGARFWARAGGGAGPAAHRWLAVRASGHLREIGPGGAAPLV
jgi:hypothetical protein